MYVFSKTSQFNTMSSWRFQYKIKGKEEIQFFAFLEVFHFQSRNEEEDISNLKTLIFSVF